MVSILSDYLVIFSLILLIVITFISSLPLLYLDKKYFEETALVNAINAINDAIQSVYAQPLKSLTLKIYLPSGTWISISNNTIELSKPVKIILNDPNNIIASFNDSVISYKIRFSNNIIINKNINTIEIECNSIKEITIAEL